MEHSESSVLVPLPHAGDDSGLTPTCPAAMLQQMHHLVGERLQIMNSTMRRARS
jgi:hypothetical protein